MCFKALSIYLFFHTYLTNSDSTLKNNMHNMFMLMGVRQRKQ